MPGMPKHVEKGPTLRTLDRELRSALTRAETLVRVRGWLAAFDGVDASALAGCVPGLSEAEYDHLARDWFGSPEQSFWVGWEGDGAAAARIVGLTLRDALEVSLGLGTDEPIDPYVDAIARSAGVTPAVCLKQLRAARPGASVERANDQLGLRRDLPVDTYWVCEMPLFEGYVSWNPQQVTVVVTTPAIDAPMYLVHPRKRLQEQAKTSWSEGLLATQSRPPELAHRGPVFTALLDEYDRAELGS